MNRIGLTSMQRAILFLADKMGEAPLGAREICPGFHFCPDWDGLPICTASPEWEACTCTKADPQEAIQ